ncbi:integrase core domain-containing protein [Methylorubrum rhodinum]
MIERWRTHYNSTRPRSSLGHLPPAPEVVVRSAEPGGSAPSARPAIVMRPTVH